MIQVQLIEGQLSPSGIIKYDRWTSLENFDYDETSEQYYIRNTNGTHTPLSVGIDYAHPEIINLDDVIAPSGYLVTGIRFRFAGDSFENPQLQAGPIQLQIRVTPCDYPRGKLIDIHKTRWIAAQSTTQRSVFQPYTG